jgi:DNA sulfur modification protein DndC
MDPFAPPPSLSDDLTSAIGDVARELRDEYLAPHLWPWIVGFSGGKDSTLVAHLVFELLLSVAPSQRRRAVHIVANDTLVESPLVAAHVNAVQAQLREAAGAFDLPVTVATTEPAADDTFWVNLIGRGYPSPNRNFRWCTDRMKIQPTSAYVRRNAAKAGSVILLLGVRRDESPTRAGSVARYDNGERLNRHNDLAGCLVFRPIVDLSTEQVWEFLATTPPPWGGSHGPLVALYRGALGGECPVVTQKSDAPSCGTGSSRFGCWTCTVVEKDRSLAGFVAAGWGEFAPLLAFRDWLADIRNTKHRRAAHRRDGRLTVTASGALVPGPFTLAARREILDRLLATQQQVGHRLISDAELARIQAIWAADVLRFGDEQRLGVWSRDEVVRVDGERRRVFCPSIADGLEWRAPSQRLEVLGEVVRPDESEDVRLERVETGVVEGLDGGVLDGAVHSLRLSVGPGVVGLGEAVLDTVLPADSVEAVAAVARGPAAAVSRCVGEGDAVVGQHDAHLVGEGGEGAAQEVRADRHVGALVELDMGELGHAVDGEEHVALALGQAQFAGIDVDEADSGFGEATALGRCLLALGQARDAVADQASVQGRAGETGDRLAQRAQNVVERQEGAAAELDDDGLLDLGQGGAARARWPHGCVIGGGALAPLGDGLGVQTVSGGEGAGRRLRRLELGSNSRRRAG